MEYFRQAIVFLLVARFLQVFISKKENQKYIRGLAGLLTLGIMLSSVRKIVLTDINKEISQNIANMQGEEENLAKLLLQECEGEGREDFVSHIQNGRGEVGMNQADISVSLDEIVIPKIKISLGVW